MAEKNKTQPKNIPKDGQVIVAILKEMGVTEFEPKTLVQLMEFVYRYGTSIIEEARLFANNKKFIDLNDVRLALQLSAQTTFTSPPLREVLLECARNKNNNPLPLIKPHCGPRLPPDRHCLSSCNYTLKGSPKKQNASGGNATGYKFSGKTNLNFIKRSSINMSKPTVTVGKPIAKVSNPNLQQQKTILKPKINTQVVVTNNTGDMETESGLKRKREDEDVDGSM